MAGVPPAWLDNTSVCENELTGTATAGIRLRAFAQAFARHSVHSICAGDLEPAMTAIAAQVGMPR